MRSSPADDEDEVALRGPERYVHRYLPAPGLPSEGARGPTQAGVPYRLAARRPGTLDGLVLQKLRRQPPGPGEVEIEVVAAGLNFSDVMKALGMYPGLPDGPVPLGAECSGRITAVGEGVNELRDGDDVLAVAGFAFGSHVVTRAELVAIKPPRLSFEEAATLPIAFLTASLRPGIPGPARPGRERPDPFGVRRRWPRGHPVGPPRRGRGLRHRRHSREARVPPGTGDRLRHGLAVAGFRR